MRDIAPELLEKIKTDFDKSLAVDKKLIKTKSKIAKKEGTFEDAAEYATRAGELLAKALNTHIKANELPNGRMYYNIASRVLDPVLSELHSHVSIASAEVQEWLNKRAKLGIKAMLAEKNQSRIDGIVNRVASAEKFTDVAWMLDEPVVNFSQSIVDDTIKANVDFHAKAGLCPQIIRKEAGNCCDWCKGLAGIYDYPAPQEVYQRHRFCRCTVEYDPRDGKRQDIHTKKWTDPQKNDKIKKRKSFGLKKKSQEYRNLELENAIRNDLIPKENTNEIAMGAQSKHRVGTNEYKNEAERYKSKGEFGPGKIDLTDNEILEIVNKYKGTGRLRIANGEWQRVETIVNNERKVGTVVNNLSGKEAETSVFKIHYSDKGVHISPDYPSKRREK